MAPPARAKLVALGEVLLVFALAVLIFQGLRQTPIHRWEKETLSGLYFLEYGGTLSVTLGLLILFRRDLAAYGLCLDQPQYQLRIVAIAFLPTLMLSGALTFFDWTGWSGAAIVTGVAIGVLLLVGFLLRDVKPAGQVGAAAGGLLLIVGAAATADVTWWTIPLKVVYFYLVVGPTEEILFRGYIHSRLERAFERPFQLFGVPLGWGWIGAAVLFGLWHVAFDPLRASAWPHALWTTAAGLFFGFVRAKSDSVIAPSILHGVMNYLPGAEFLG